MSDKEMEKGPTKKASEKITIGGVNISDTKDSRVDIKAGSDIVGRDKIIHNVNNVIQQAASASREADTTYAYATKRLADGVKNYAQRLAAVVEQTSDVIEESGPYKGLLSYRLSDAEMFYGRDQAIEHLIRIVNRNPLTVLHSESGAGKSSLLQAGISPYLLAKPTPDLPVYLRIYNTSPTLAIKQAFLPHINDVPELKELKVAPLQAFLRQVVDILGSQATLYLLLDQFEELFTTVKEDERAAFISELATCIRDDSLHVRWVLALRSEFFSDIANFRPEIENPFENEFRLNRLTLTEARQVIVAPAEQQGFSFEPALVEVLLDELRDDREQLAPPQIQLVCSALYNLLLEQKRTSSKLPNLITLKMYEDEGRAKGILQGHLRRVLSRTLPTKQERDLARQVLIALISSDQRRRRLTQSHLSRELSNYIVTAQDADEVLEQLDPLLGGLVKSRLLNVERDEESDEYTYELAHDYLLTEIEIDPELQAQKAAQEMLYQEVESYQQFKTLLSKDKFAIISSQLEFLVLDDTAQELLQLSQEDFEAEEREKEAVRQRELEQAQQLAEAEKNRAAQAQKLAEAEKAQAQLQTKSAKRFRKFAFGLGIALIFALTAMLCAFVNMYSAITARAEAEENIDEMTDLLSEVSHTLVSERAEKIIGFGPVQLELLNVLVPYQEYVVDRAEQNVLGWQTAETYHQIGRSQEERGNSTEAEASYRQAFEEAISAADSLGPEGSLPSELLDTLSTSAVFYAWGRMNAGDLDEASSVLNTANLYISGNDINQDHKILVSAALIENALARLEGEKGNEELALQHQSQAVELARRAVTLNGDSVTYKRRLAVYLQNLSNTSSTLMRPEEAQEYEREACEIVREANQLEDSGAILLSPLVACVYDESFSGTPDEIVASLLDIRSQLDTLVNFDPTNQEIKLLRAYVTVRLMDVEYFRRNDKEAANEYFEEALSDWLDILETGSIPQDVWRLRVVYFNLRDHINEYYRNDETEKERLFSDIVSALNSASDAFSDAPEIAVITADSALELSELQKESNDEELLSNINKAVDFFEKAQILNHTSTFNERYARVCKAYEARLVFNFNNKNVDAVVADLERINERCRPVFEQYPFDFYLHLPIRNAHIKAGELLFEVGRYEEAIPILEYASYWGSNPSTDLLARAYREGLGVPIDEVKAEGLENLAARQYDGMKRFTIPVDFGNGVKDDFYFYVYDGPIDAEYIGIEDQVEWIKQARGGTVPPDAVEAFRKLFDIAVENEVSFPELVAYALNEAKADIVFGIVNSNDCQLVTDITSQILQERLDINVNQQQYQNKTELFDALAAGEAQVTVCYIAPDDFSQLERVTGDAIKQIGAYHWDSGNGRWQVWANAKTQNTWRLAESCAFSILENLRFETGSFQTSDVQSWLTSHADEIDSWAECADQ